MADRTKIIEVLETASSLTGAAKLSLQCDHENLETVYVDVRDGAVVLGDQGKTWGWVTGHPDDQQPWDEPFVSAIAAEHDISIEIEHWSDTDDEVTGKELTIVLGDDERLRDAFDRLADVVDAIFDHHHIGDGWRNDD